MGAQNRIQQQVFMFLWH